MLSSPGPPPSLDALFQIGSCYWLSVLSYYPLSPLSSGISSALPSARHCPFCSLSATNNTKYLRLPFAREILSGSAMARRPSLASSNKPGALVNGSDKVNFHYFQTSTRSKPFIVVFLLSRGFKGFPSVSLTFRKINLPRRDLTQSRPLPLLLSAAIFYRLSMLVVGGHSLSSLTASPWFSFWSVFKKR